MTQKFFQVVLTFDDRSIEGRTYGDIEEALRSFVKFGKSNCCALCYFHEIGSKQVTYYTDKLAWAEVKQDEESCTFLVNFFNKDTTAEEMLDRLDGYRITEGYEGRYYKKVQIFDMFDGSLLMELIQEKK